MLHVMMEILLYASAKNQIKRPKVSKFCAELRSCVKVEVADLGSRP